MPVRYFLLNNLQQNYSAAQKLCDKRKAQRKINLILITYQFKKKIVSIQIGFYANTSQKPILKEIGLILNNKIREWINIRSTISRYLPTVEHQLT